MRCFVIALFLFCELKSYSQNKSVIVRDIITDEPITNVEVIFGYNMIRLNSDAKLDLDRLIESDQIVIDNGTVTSKSIRSQKVSIYNLEGRQIKLFSLYKYGDAYSLLNLPIGWYLLKTDKISLKFLNQIGRYQTSTTPPNKIIIRSNDYEEMKLDLDEIIDEESIYLVKKNYALSFLNKLKSRTAFNVLKGKPFSQNINNVESVKLLFDIKSDTLHYFNTKSFLVHYDFALNVLNYFHGKAHFSEVEYTVNDNRTYIPASLDYYKDSDKYIIDISAFTEVTCQEMEQLYNKVLSTSFISRDKLFLKNLTQVISCSDLNYIDLNKLNEDQIYQPLILKQTYGYLRKITVSRIKDLSYSKSDILLLDEDPIDLGVCAGVITNVFQTPLSHINVLSHNRGTPNMGFRGSFTSPQFAKLIGKPVYLKVELDTFILREVPEAELLAYWNSNQTKLKKVLDLDTLTKGLVYLNNRSHIDVKTIGGKAANFAEMLKIKLDDNSTIPLPEHAVGIPFYYYNQHITSNDIVSKIKNLLNNETIIENPSSRYLHLKQIRKSIIDAKLSIEILELMKNHLKISNEKINFRFRSSTNAEDIEGFNGAGLYDSYSGNLNDKDLELTIKKVWASLWNDRAFDERAFFGLDHNSISMAILVHRSFSSELANGVVLTHNPYNQFNSAIIINTQPEEISVVRPDTKLIPEQVLYYDYKIKKEAYEYLSYSNHPSFINKRILSETHLKTIQIYALAIKNHYCKLNTSCKIMDIEFKLDLVNGKEKIYIKQARYY